MTVIRHRHLRRIGMLSFELKIKWLKEGDSNSAFFHRNIVAGIRKYIQKIISENDKGSQTDRGKGKRRKSVGWLGGGGLWLEMPFEENEGLVWRAITFKCFTSLITK